MTIYSKKNLITIHNKNTFRNNKEFCSLPAFRLHVNHNCALAYLFLLRFNRLSTIRRSKRIGWMTILFQSCCCSWIRWPRMCTTRIFRSLRFRLMHGQTCRDTWFLQWRTIPGNISVRWIKSIWRLTQWWTNSAWKIFIPKRYRPVVNRRTVLAIVERRLDSWIAICMTQWPLTKVTAKQSKPWLILGKKQLSVWS